MLRRCLQPLLCSSALGVAVLIAASGHTAEWPAAMPTEVPTEVPVAQLSERNGAIAADAAARAVPPLAYPLAQPALQIDPWGWRYSESRGAWRMHTGVDFAADSGTPVLAALPGTVVLAEAISGYGLTVILDHGHGLQTLYAHLQQIDVALGASLEQGQAIGLLGMTGTATGPHLHFELRRQDGQSIALDPTPHLPPLQPPPALTASRP